MTIRSLARACAGSLVMAAALTPAVAPACAADGVLRRRDQHLGLQHPVHGAVLGDAQKPGPLLRRELTVELQLALDVIQLPGFGLAIHAIVGVNPPVAQPHRDAAQRPALALGVHADGDGGTGAQAGQEQVVRCGAAVGATNSDGLVRG